MEEILIQSILEAIELYYIYNAQRLEAEGGEERAIPRLALQDTIRGQR